MVNIERASAKDYKIIARLGRITVELAHKESCSEKDMSEFIQLKYNDDEIFKELSDLNNIYHIIKYKGKDAGFSKIVFNAAHPNIQQAQVTKLDRIYLLEEFYNLKLGYKLLQFNMELSKSNNQIGMWLFTWIGNQRAVDFYLKAGFEIIGSHDFKISETHSNPNHQMFLKYEHNHL